MFLDHSTITATNSLTEPDRLERLNRVHGFVIALADRSGAERYIEKVTQMHDYKGSLIVFWNDAPSAAEKEYFVQAWASGIGDGSRNVGHEV